MQRDRRQKPTGNDVGRGRRRRWALAAALVAVASVAPGCAWNANAAPGSTSLASEPLVVDATWDSDVPVVEVHLGSHGPYRFLVDTGAGTSIVSPRCAREAGLVAKDESLRINAAGMGTDQVLPATTIPDLRLGGARFTDVSAVVAESGAGLDGIVGFPVFADVLLTFDGPNERLILEHGRLPPPEESPDSLAIEVEVNAVAHPSARVWGRIGGRRALFLVDSGFAGFLWLAPTIPEEVGLPFERDADWRATALTRTGRREIEIGRLRGRVEIAGVALDDVPTMIGRGPTVMLGGAFLREVVTTFDQRTQRVRIVAPDR